MRVEGTPIAVWVARVAWVVLPVVAGPLVTGTVDDWSHAPRLAAESLAWLVWAAVLVALVALRPLGLSTTRVLAPTLAITALVAALMGTGSVAIRVIGVSAALVATALALSRPVAAAFVNGAAYGDEQRFPLRVPPPLLLLPIPAAVAIMGGTLVAVPLLLADRRWIAGALVAFVGGLASARLARSVHALSNRFLVLVPAGVVIKDPLTLADPVLFPREHIAALHRGEASTATGDGTFDCRLGATLATTVLELDDEATLLAATRPGRTLETVRATRVLVAPARPEALLTAAQRRRIPVAS